MVAAEVVFFLLAFLIMFWWKVIPGLLQVKGFKFGALSGIPTSILSFFLTFFLQPGAISLTPFKFIEHVSTMIYGSDGSSIVFIAFYFGFIVLIFSGIGGHLGTRVGGTTNGGAVGNLHSAVGGMIVGSLLGILSTLAILLSNS
jgi:hypothetical protein